jgi:hypothetical protein
MKALFLGIALTLAALRNHAQTPLTLDLAGDVISPPGKSVSATVLISHAESKPTLQSPRPTRYPNLPKRTRTDGQGHFRIESLDPAWLYHVVILAPGCQQQSFEKVDPASGPLTARLEAVLSTNRPPDTVMHGRVLNDGRQPVPGALIRIQGVTRDGKMHWPVSTLMAIRSRMTGAILWFMRRRLSPPRKELRKLLDLPRHSSEDGGQAPPCMC